MYIVADAGAVVSRIVVAEDAQLFPYADGGLRDLRHEVVGYAVRILAYEPGLVSADRIEIA